MEEKLHLLDDNFIIKYYINFDSLMRYFYGKSWKRENITLFTRVRY